MQSGLLLHPSVIEPVRVRFLIPLAGFGGLFARGVGEQSIWSCPAVCPLSSVAEAPLGCAATNDPLVLATWPAPGIRNPTSPALVVTSCWPELLTVLSVNEAVPPKE
jgi:hypothetical protein